MARRSVIIELRGKGLTYAQIAERLKVREQFVREMFGQPSIAQPSTTKPNGNRKVYQRAALEVVLRRKERQAFALAKDITTLRQRIEEIGT